MPIPTLGRPTLLVCLVGLALVVVLAVTALVAWRGFAGLYGQDAFFYHAYAVGELREALVRLQPLPLPAFTWTPGFPILVAVASLVVGTGSLAGQLVSVLSGAVVPALTVLLARELGVGRRVGAWGAAWLPLLAGAMVALTPHLWQSSAVVMSDTAGLAAASLGAWGVVRYARTRRLAWLTLGAAALAFAIDVRWVYALVAVPLGAAGVVAAWRGATRRNAAAAHLVVGGCAAGLVLAPVVLPMIAATIRGEPIPFAIQLQSHGWDPANILRSSFDGPDGHFDFALPMGGFYLLEPARPYHLGPLFALLALAGAGSVARRPDALRVAVLVGWPLLVIGFLAGDTTQNTRFILAALPPMAILSALGVAAVATLADRGPPGWARARRSALLAVVSLGLLVQAASAVRFTDAFIVRQQADLAAIHDLVVRIPRGQRVLAFGATLALRADGIEAIELYALEPPDILALVGDGKPTWLILPTDGIESQWAAKPPGRDVAALRAGPGLTRVSASGSWTLYLVGSHLS